MNHLPGYSWSPITDLPNAWQQLATSELPALFRVWQEQSQQLRESPAFQVFMERMRREIAIETGVIERLYSIDRGITQLLIEEGIDSALIPHGATDLPAEEVVRMVSVHEQAIDWMFDFVKQQRTLTTSYIRELHQFLTQHQEYTEAIDQFGKRFRTPLERGVWKKSPNNPMRPDGFIHEYCPPFNVASEMDNLIKWHQAHLQQRVPPEIEAAWLHHRFTQIHPFQDGNGRVARCLVTLVLIRDGYFPLVVTRDDRVTYIEALEQADAGDLAALVNLFVKRQKRAFVQALGLSQQVLAEGAAVSSIVAAVAETLSERKSQTLSDARKTVESFAAHLLQSTADRLKAVSQEIKQGLKGIIKSHDLRLYTDQKPDSPATRPYYRAQIIETARQLDYYANVQAYHGWAVLGIQMTAPSPESHAEILFSFHVLGREYRGLLVCSACVYWKEPADNGGNLFRDVKPLMDTPFQFSYADQLPDLDSRFKLWLESCLIAGLDYWRKGI
jgi:Fic family protein